MAVQTFTSGQILTAADTNTYLANAGLVFVSSTAVGAGVGSITVNSCFDSTYDAYLIVASGVTSSTASQEVYINLNGGPTAWKGNLISANFASGAPTSTGFTTPATPFGGSCAFNTFNMFAQVRYPNLASTTFISAEYEDETKAGRVQVALQNTTQYTGFFLSPASGTFTGGVITVYGYRKA